MTVTVSTVYLLDVATDKLVEAQLRDRIEERNLKDWESKWRPVIVETVKRLAGQNVPTSRWPQSAHWDWRGKIEDMRGLLSGASFSIECDGVTQGMMALNTARRAQIEGQKGQHLVYVDYVEAAPWNRIEHVAQPRYRGVGSTSCMPPSCSARAKVSRGGLPSAASWTCAKTTELRE